MMLSSQQLQPGKISALLLRESALILFSLLTMAVWAAQTARSLHNSMASPANFHSLMMTPTTGFPHKARDSPPVWITRPLVEALTLLRRPQEKNITTPNIIIFIHNI